MNCQTNVDSVLQTSLICTLLCYCTNTLWKRKTSCSWYHYKIVFYAQYCKLQTIFKRFPYAYGKRIKNTSEWKCIFFRWKCVKDLQRKIFLNIYQDDDSLCQPLKWSWQMVMIFHLNSQLLKIGQFYLIKQNL